MYYKIKWFKYYLNTILEFSIFFYMFFASIVAYLLYLLVFMTSRPFSHFKQCQLNGLIYQILHENVRKSKKIRIDDNIAFGKTITINFRFVLCLKLTNFNCYIIIMINSLLLLRRIKFSMWRLKVMTLFCLTLITFCFSMNLISLIEHSRRLTLLF